MLMISRRVGDLIHLDCGELGLITITVTKIRSPEVRVGIDAPQAVRIRRVDRDGPEAGELVWSCPGDCDCRCGSCNHGEAAR